jgi:hypothetical protein
MTPYAGWFHYIFSENKNCLGGRSQVRYRAVKTPWLVIGQAADFQPWVHWQIGLAAWAQNWAETGHPPPTVINVTFLHVVSLCFPFNPYNF